MKYIFSLIVIFELAVTWGTIGVDADVLPRDCVQEQILNKLTQWRKSGSLEVIRIDSVAGDYEGFGIQVTYVSGDMQLRGANNFIVEQVFMSTKDLKASATVHFPLLTLTADQYRLTGRAYHMYSLKGAGLMNVTFQNIEITLGITLVPKGVTALEVDDVSLNFSVGNIQVSLADSSWPINKVLNMNAMKILEKQRSALIPSANRMLKNIINEHVASTKRSQLLGMVDTDCDSLSSNYID